MQHAIPVILTSIPKSPSQSGLPAPCMQLCMLRQLSGRIVMLQIYAIMSGRACRRVLHAHLGAAAPISTFDASRVKCTIRELGKQTARAILLPADSAVQCLWWRTEALQGANMLFGVTFQLHHVLRCRWRAEAVRRPRSGQHALQSHFQAEELAAGR